MHFGNFISGQVKEHTKSTAILDMNITKNGETGKITIDSIDYTPVFCYNKGAGTKNRYELIDIRQAIEEYENGNKSNVSSTLYSTLKKELANIEKVLGEPITKENKNLVQEDSEK